MNIEIRKGRPEDAESLGAICYEAFYTVSNAHNFPPDFPHTESATGFMHMALGHPEMHSFVAELDGRIVGSNFLAVQSSIAGVGPITVDPKQQNGNIGKRLMQAVIARADELGLPGVRLCQAAFHNRSLSLYTKLGFDVREPLAIMQGAPIGKAAPGFNVRAAKPADADAMNAVCIKVHGHDRRGEVRDFIAQGAAQIVERDGRITGYSTLVGFFGHALGETNEDMKALIANAPDFAGVGFLLPTRNSELFRWCLANGLKVVQPMTLMSRGLYNEPKGAFLPSILF